jgi:hypothetical protein
MGPRPRTVAPLMALGCLAAVVLAAAHPHARGYQEVRPTASDPALQAATLLQGRIPVVAEQRYRLIGKVRLLLFWVGKDDVGGARLRWRRADGETGYDLLIGSDPARAPRKMNRWGFIMEESRADATTVLGVMKKGQEQTLDEVKSNETAGEVAFDMVNASVDATESVARLTTAKVRRDYSFHELSPLLGQLVKEAPSPTERRTAVPAGGRKGLLHAVADLVQESVEAVRATSRPPARKSLPYVYYRKQYDLARTASSVETKQSYGGVRYARLVRSDYEITARGESWTEHFTLVCGIDGPLAGVPVFISYQPRWWFKVELVLDERQTF